MRLSPRSLAASAALALALGSIARGQTLLYSVEGDASSNAFAVEIDGVGDVDGDGVEDLVVGESSWSGFAGRVKVLSGRTGATILDWIGAPPAAGRHLLGTAVTGLGDVNGDGVPDVAYTCEDSSGPSILWVVVVRSGADGSQLTEFSGSASRGYGSALDGGGDSDGDGVLELLVGEPRYKGLFVPQAYGRVHRIELGPGSSSSSLVVGPATNSDSNFGAAVAWVGDVDGDGLDEYAVGMPTWSSSSTLTTPVRGAVAVYDGTGSQLWFDAPSFDDSWFGYAVRGLGDTDGDGLPELAVGAPLWFNESGLVELFDGQSGTSRGTRAGTTAGARFGVALADPGDVDGDGVGDLAVGAPDLGSAAPSPGTISLLRGTNLTTISSRSGTQPGESYGFSLASLADPSGDGSRNLLVGAPQYDVPGGGEGRLLVLDPDGVPASSTPFGLGTAGTLGIPSLTCTAPPALGTTIQLVLENSSGLQQTGALFAGRTDAVIPLLGGLLFVVPTIVEPLPLVPPTGAAFVLPVPTDLLFAGQRYVVQGLQLDAGAPQGVSFSPPLALRFGGQ